MSRQIETMLRVCRRRKYGSLVDAARAIGISRWTLQRAEVRRPVGIRVQQKLLAEFGVDSWRTLMLDWMEIAS